MSHASALEQYEVLLGRVDALFREIRERNLEHLQCRLGCHSCCKPGLTVGPLEAARIESALAADPARSAALLAQEAANPHRGKRCSFLSAEGGCGIYEYRPLVCRSHGVPLQFRDPGSTKEEAVRFRDVCPLNFQGVNLETISTGDVMNLDTLNTLLAMLGNMAFGKKAERRPLAPSALIKAPETTN